MGKKQSMPNVFYVALVVASTVFTLTVFVYLIGPFAVRRAQANAAADNSGSMALISWFDRNGPNALAIEFVVMLVSAVLAMLTDHWFQARTGGATRGE